jgi:AcrR family transcriptional regulator
MAFGKPGRPLEDRLARQREIYLAVSPLILERGARGLSMHAASRAACMSIGGLYHYFPTKRDLVLHGLQPEAIARNCQDFHEQYGCLAETDPPQFLEAYLGFLSDSIQFIRPAIQAALESGLDTLDEVLEPTLNAANQEFIVRIQHAFPLATEEELSQAARAIHRTIVAALFDRNTTADEFREQVTVLINGYLAARQTTSALDTEPVHHAPVITAATS